MANQNKTALALARESGGFGVDPDATGAAYTWVKTHKDGLSHPKNLTEVLETGWAQGRNRETASEVGAEAHELEVATPLQGLSAAAGDGVAVPAEDWLDLLFQSPFGSSVNVAGEGVANGSLASNLILDAASYAVQDLMPVHETGLNGSRTQWRRAGSLATATYTLDRNWTATPTTAAVAYGTRTYQYSDAGGGDHLLGYFDQDGTPYVLQGGRVTKLSIGCVAGQMARVLATLRFDNKVQASRASVPVIDTFAGTPIKGMRLSVIWGGTEIAVKSVNIDFGLGASDVEATSGAQGRSGIEVFQAFPTITIEPQFSTSLETDFAAQTQRSLMITFGAGTLSGGVLNTCCFWAEAAQVVSGVDAKKDNGRLRQSIQLKVRDEGVFSGSTVSRYWQFARA